LLIDNGYHLNLIFRKKNLRIEKLFNKNCINDNEFENVNHISNNDNKKKISPTCGTKIATSSIDKSKCIVGYMSLNNLNTIDSAYKHKIDFNIKNNVFYKIRYKNCDASYIGQTKRQLQTRHIKKHINSINNKRIDPSRHTVILKHIHGFNYNFYCY